MKAVVAAFNQEKALVGAFSVITNLRMELFEALLATDSTQAWELAEGLNALQQPQLSPAVPPRLLLFTSQQKVNGF